MGLGMFGSRAKKKWWCNSQKMLFGIGDFVPGICELLDSHENLSFILCMKPCTRLSYVSRTQLAHGLYGWPMSLRSNVPQCFQTWILEDLILYNENKCCNKAGMPHIPHSSCSSDSQEDLFLNLSWLLWVEQSGWASVSVVGCGVLVKTLGSSVTVSYAFLLLRNLHVDFIKLQLCCFICSPVSSKGFSFLTAWHHLL